MPSNLPESLPTAIVVELTGLSDTTLKKRARAGTAALSGPGGVEVHPARTKRHLLWPTRRLAEALSLTPEEMAQAVARAQERIEAQKNTAK